jgi:hypothetical protein
LGLLRNKLVSLEALRKHHQALSVRFKNITATEGIIVHIEEKMFLKGG